MSFLSTLASIGGVAAAPFTGGASLAATIPGLIGAGTDLAGTLINRGGINSAQKAQLGAIQAAKQGLSNTQINASDTLREGQNEAYQAALGGVNQIQANNRPYQELGGDATMALGSMLDSGELGKPVNFEFNPSDVSKYLDPSLQFTMDQAAQALSRSAAGRGALRSGGTLKDLTNYEQNIALQKGYQPAFQHAFDVAQQNYQAAQTNQANKFNRTFSLASMGQQSTGQTNQALADFYKSVMGLDENTANAIASGQMTTAGKIADLTAGAGNVRAAGSIARANNATAGIGNLGYDVSKLYSLGSMQRGNINPWQAATQASNG